MQNLKTIIIDDSTQARKLLRIMIREVLPQIVVMGEASAVAEGLALIVEHRPDFILLDIEMPGRTGIQLVEDLISQNIDCQVIFTTAYNEYAIQAFRLSAIDYLLKPIKETELVQAVEKTAKIIGMKQAAEKLQVFARNFKKDKPEVLSIPVLNGYEYIPINEIEYIEASGSYSTIYLLQGKPKTVSKNLKFFEEALQHFSSFYRVHRSCLINIRQVKAYSRSDNGGIVLYSGKTINLARDRRLMFLEIFEKNKISS